jgi:hypothetical protein
MKRPGLFWRVRLAVDSDCAWVALMVNARGDAQGNCGPIRAGPNARAEAAADGFASGLPEWTPAAAVGAEPNI